MPKRKWQNKNPARRLSIDFPSEAAMIRFYESVIQPYFLESGIKVSIFSRDRLDDRQITNSQEFIVKKEGARPYGEMVVKNITELIAKETPCILNEWGADPMTKEIPYDKLPPKQRKTMDRLNEQEERRHNES
jgi:hypothetical protein